MIATQIGYVLLLLALSIHLFDVTLFCMLVFTIFLCALIPMFYENIHSELRRLNHILSK